MEDKKRKESNFKWSIYQK